MFSRTTQYCGDQDDAYCGTETVAPNKPHTPVAFREELYCYDHNGNQVKQKLEEDQGGEPVEIDWEKARQFSSRWVRIAYHLRSRPQHPHSQYSPASEPVPQAHFTRRSAAERNQDASLIPYFESAIVNIKKRKSNQR